MSVPDPAPRLVLVNGMPGVGKSTLARRWASADDRRAVVDADVLRSAMTGEPADTARWSRGQALAVTAAHLGDGADVVVPQLVARVDQLARFEQVARDVGARTRHRSG